MYSQASRLKRRRASSLLPDGNCLEDCPRQLRHLPKRRIATLALGEKPCLRPSLLTHRGDNTGVFSSSSDTEAEGFSDDELGTALSDVESVVRGERIDSSPADGDDEEIDVVLMASGTAPSSPLAPGWPLDKGKAVDPREHGERPGKRRRLESPDCEDDGDGDDEREADTMLMLDGKFKLQRKPPPFLFNHPYLAPTRSIVEITRYMHGLAASSSPNIEVDAQTSSDEDSELIVADMVLDSSPTPRPKKPTHILRPLRVHRKPKLEGVVRNLHQKRLHPMALSAADPFLASPALRSWCPDGKMPIDRKLLAPSDVEKRGLVVARGVQRLPQHSSYPERLPGQNSTSRLHRYSPTSLLPRRQRITRGVHHHSSRDAFVIFSSGPCKTGQAWLAALHIRRSAQTKRRDFMHRYNERTKGGPWVEKVGKWNLHGWVVACSSPWWLEPAHPEEEGEVESLLPAADVDGDVDSNAVDAFLGGEQATVSPRKRIVRTDAGLGEEAAVRWARRNELRLRDEVLPHIDRLRRRHEARRVAAGRGCHERAEAAHRRIEAERTRQEEQMAAVAQQGLAASSPPPPPPARDDSPVLSSIRSEGSPAPSEPPEYEFPFYPVVIPAPAHLRLRPTANPGRRTITSPPNYIRNLRYRSLSPPPPPPYNASTDRETLVVPVFIEDDAEEEAMLARMQPSGLFRSPSPEPVVVGAFPEGNVNVTVRQAARTAWDAAPELEEGEEDFVEGAFDDENRDVTEQVPVLGTMIRLLGRVWRW